MLIFNVKERSHSCELSLPVVEIFLILTGLVLNAAFFDHKVELRRECFEMNYVVFESDGKSMMVGVIGQKGIEIQLLSRRNFETSVVLVSVDVIEVHPLKPTPFTEPYPYIECAMWHLD